MITKQEESTGYLFALEQKGGPGSGNFGHTGIPGHVGGSGSGGGSGSRSKSQDKEHIAEAANWLSKQPKQYRGQEFSKAEKDSLLKDGYKKVEGHTAFIRGAAKPLFDDEFAMVQVHQGSKQKSYTAMYFNKVGEHWIVASDKGFSTDAPGNVGPLGGGGLG